MSKNKPVDFTNERLNKAMAQIKCLEDDVDDFNQLMQEALGLMQELSQMEKNQWVKFVKTRKTDRRVFIFLVSLNISLLFLLLLFMLIVGKLVTG